MQHMQTGRRKAEIMTSWLQTKHFNTDIDNRRQYAHRLHNPGPREYGEFFPGCRTLFVSSPATVSVTYS